MTDEMPALEFAEHGWCRELGKSYRPGAYQPRSRVEYDALLPYSTGNDSLPVAPAAAPAPEEPSGDADAPGPGPAFDPATATRAELMAFLKASGQPASATLSTEKLRDMAAGIMARGQ